MTERDKSIITFCIILLIALVGGKWYLNKYFFQNKIKQFETQKAEVQKRIDSIQKEIDDAQAILDEKDKIAERVELVKQIEKRLPSSPNAREFYLTIVDILEASGVKYNFVLPEPAIARDIYTEIPYRLELNCGYHELGEFISLIEENPDRIMRLNDFDVTHIQGRPTTHKVVMKISTFMFHKSAAK